MAQPCIFCRIAAKEIQSKIVFEDPELVAFEDLNPQAPIHILVIPRVHMAFLTQAGLPHMGLLGKMMLVAKDLAVKLNAQDGFRLVLNNGPGIQQLAIGNGHHAGGAVDFELAAGVVVQDVVDGIRVVRIGSEGGADTPKPAPCMKRATQNC